MARSYVPKTKGFAWDLSLMFEGDFGRLVMREGLESEDIPILSLTAHGENAYALAGRLKTVFQNDVTLLHPEDLEAVA